MKYMGPDDSWYEPPCEEPEVEFDFDLIKDNREAEEAAEEEYYLMMLG